MKKIIMAVLIVVAVWFVGVWQTGRVAVETLEKQIEIAQESAMGGATVEIEWDEKSFFGASGTIVAKGVEEDLEGVQTFSLKHGFLKSDFKGHLSFTWDSFDLAQVYGVEGIETTGSFGLGGFTYNINLGGLEFSNDTLQLSHAPLIFRAVGDDKSQQVELSLDSLTVNPSDGEALSIEGLVFNGAAQFDGERRIIRQEGGFLLQSISLESADTTIGESSSAWNWRKQGNSIVADYEMRMKDAVSPGGDSQINLNIGYEGGDYEAIYAEYEAFMEVTRELSDAQKDGKMQQQPPEEFEEAAQRLGLALLTPEMSLQVDLSDTNLPSLGEIGLNLVFTGPASQVQGVSGAEISQWALQGTLEGEVTVVPQPMASQLQMQFGLDTANLPWAVSYQPSQGLTIDGVVVIPANAMAGPK